MEPVFSACGVQSEDVEEGDRTVIRKSERGDWPWQGLLFHNRDDSVEQVGVI